MWIEKYVPQSLSEMVGNADVITEIRLWANAWKQGKVQKPLLLVGPPGVGKTLAAYTVAKEMGWSLVEFNSSDQRNEEAIERSVSAAALNASFTGQPRLVLLDEIDGIQGTQDKGGLSAVLTVLKEARNPVILTANDIYADKRLAGIRTFCKMLPFKKVAYPSIAKFLREIGEKENIDYDAVSINELAKNASGDVRGALLDFESLARGTKKITLEDVQNSGYRERLDNIFNAMRVLYTSPSLKEIRRMRASVEVDHDLLKKWVEENIPRQFPMQPSLSIAMDQLSRADVFDGRIFRRQHYGFLKYSGDLSASVGVSTPERAHGWISYQFPGVLKKLSLLKNSSKKSAIQKIQKHEYGSRKRISQELVFWHDFLSDEKNAVDWTHTFEFDEDELGFLLQTTPSSAKVKRLLAQVEERKDPTPSKKTKSSDSDVEEPKSSRKRGTKSVSDTIKPEEIVLPAQQTEEDAKSQTSLSNFFK